MMDKNQLAVNLFDKRAQDYQDKYMDVSHYHDSFDVFCEHIPIQNPEILELACGPGNITQYLLKKRPDFQILGTDLSPNMVGLAEINNPTAKFQLLDCRQMLSLNKQFDAIMCGFCLPYLSKEEALQLIADAAKVLNDNGVLYLSTMEADYSKSGIQRSSKGDELYMYFHQGDYLTEALAANGFNIIDLRRQEFQNWDGSVAIDLLVVAGKV